MDTILVLGGTGFIGKNIVDLLGGNSQYNLIIVVRNKELLDRNSFFKNNVTIKQGSIEDNNFIEGIIFEFNVTVVLHLISNLIPSSSNEDFYIGFKEVILPTIKLIDIVAERNIKFIFFSSGGTIYGKTDFLINESSDLNPINNYGYSKLIIENYIRHKSNISNLNYLIFRPSNVYGEYQRFDSNQGFISVAIKKIYNNTPIEIWGDGNVIRDYIHVIDVVKIIEKALVNDLSNNTFNLSTGIGLSLLEIIKIIEKKLDKMATINFADRRIVDANKVILDNKKLLGVIDHKFISIMAGIDMQLEYFNTTIING